MTLIEVAFITTSKWLVGRRSDITVAVVVDLCIADQLDLDFPGTHIVDGTCAGVLPFAFGVCRSFVFMSVGVATKNVCLLL